MLYCDDIQTDIINVLDHIDEYAQAIGVNSLAVNSASWKRACHRMRDRDEFPCRNGIENASIFKRAAVFVACFIEEKPIDADGFKQSHLPEKIKKHDPNAIIALNIALMYISGATIERSDGETFKISKGLKLSDHSYIDFIDMLSNDVCLSRHFMALSLLFEQITYKNHPELQYKLNTYGVVSSDEVDEQEGHPEWDDYVDFWKDIE